MYLTRTRAAASFVLDWMGWNIFLHLTLFWNSVSLPARNNKINASESIWGKIMKNRSRNRSIFQNQLHNTVNWTDAIDLHWLKLYITTLFLNRLQWGYSKDQLAQKKLAMSTIMMLNLQLTRFSPFTVSWWIYRWSEKDILRKEKDLLSQKWQELY